MTPRRSKPSPRKSSKAKPRKIAKPATTKSARAKRPVSRKEKPAMSDTTVAYKAFNPDMTCRDFQFEVGKTYVEPRAELCSSGFHACPLPFSCWGYYPNAKTFARVAMHDAKGDGDKLVTAKITIEAALRMPDWIKAQVAGVGAIVQAAIAPLKKSVMATATTGERAHSATTGYGAHSATTGYGAHSKALGNNSVALALGTYDFRWAQGSKVAAGDNGCVVAAWMDGNGRKRLVVGYVGENGIKAKTWYAARDGALVDLGPVE